MHKTPIFPPEDSHVEFPDGPAKSRVRRLARPAALVLGLTLGVAACGSSSETTDTSSGDAPAAATDDESSPDESNDESAADDSSDAADGENLFPNVNVQSIDDGSTLNLAEELSGGDKAVLLWFFAPH